MAKMSKGVVVEFDFAVLNGSEILFETASSILKGYGITLDARLEALHLAGGNYQGALAELFGKVDCEAEPAAVARELNAAFNAAVAAKTAAELGEVLNTVFFSPEDLFLIREGAAARRR